MLPRVGRPISPVEVLLWVAILSLIILLVVALWSFLHGALNSTDAFAVVAFACVMVGVLAWASLSSRKTADGDRKAPSIHTKSR
jgi:peptidoglycan biosynthesis protein MviN/MurJ (putative lipid II flippase)